MSTSSSTSDHIQGHSATHRAVLRRGQYMDSYYTDLSGLREASQNQLFLLKKKLNIFAVRTGSDSQHCYVGRPDHHHCAI